MLVMASCFFCTCEDFICFSVAVLKRIRVHEGGPPERKDIYDPSIKKFLVLVRDDVESAEEKLQELQQEMVDMGLMSSDFELGDLLDDPDGSGSDGGTGAGTGGGGGAVRRKLEEFPQVEGDETLQEYLGQYRRAILSRKALVKVAKERLEKDQAKGYEYLAS